MVTKKPILLPPKRVMNKPAVGDIVFAHSNGLMGRAIRLGERLRWRRGSKWNHVAIVSSVHDDIVFITQAEPRGVTNDKQLHTVGEYILITPPANISKTNMVKFATEQVGKPYSFLSIASIVLDILSPNWFPAFRRHSTWICSSLVGESLRFGGYLHEWDDIYTVTPSQLYEAICNDWK